MAEKTDSILILLFAYLGMSIAIPFNSFISSVGFFHYRLADNQTEWRYENVEYNDYQKFWSSTLTTLLSISALVVSVLLLLFGHKIFGKFNGKITIGCLVMSCFCIGFLLILSNVDTNSWQVTFFITTMLSGFIVQASMTFVLTISFVILGSLKNAAVYVNGFMIGQGLAALVSSCLNLLTKVIATTEDSFEHDYVDDDLSACIYFGTTQSSLKIGKLKFFGVGVTRRHSL